MSLPAALAALVLVAPAATSACTPFGAEPSAPMGDGGGGSVDACADPSCDAGATVRIGTCKTVHEAEPELPSGTYQLDLEGKGGAGQPLYCDMTTDGGGWTMIARSVQGARRDNSFGWRRSRGSVDVDTEPYSLGDNRIAFTEILFGTRGEGKSWGAQIYKHVVPNEFITTYGTSGHTPPGGAITVAGACKPDGGPVMIGIVGLTDLRDHYFFSDDTNTNSFGLWPDGWNTNQAFASSQSMCSYSAAIGATQGMIFVR